MAQNKIGLVIEQVYPGGIGKILAWEAGDRLIRINGTEVTDIIDYQFQVCEEEVEVVIQKPTGSLEVFSLEKDYDTDLGISFVNITNDGIRQCGNRCLFCFVDQMPADLRRSLYVKDDDYRYSFYQGTFVTLTNISPADLERIVSLRLSPLYISVHTTDPSLRTRMLRNKNAGKILTQLQFLAEHNIEMHTQVVLCHEINDGEELDRTITDLVGLWPSVQSLAIVPVGLTQYRVGLPTVAAISQANAREIITSVANYQAQFLQEMGTRFVFLADEFYLLAGKDLPDRESYEGFPQLENGVGLVSLFKDEFSAAVENLSPSYLPQGKYLLVTGTGAWPVLRNLVRPLEKMMEGFSIEVLAVENEFLGPTVTVAGLLSAQDIIAKVQGRLKEQAFDCILIPDILLNDDGLTLDDRTTKDFERAFDVTTVFLSTHGASLVEYLINH